jgi:hypothetical protein
MSQILATAVFNGPPLASGVTTASVAISVSDAGAVQNATVVGTETPPWSAPFTVAAGTGTVTFTATDSEGNVGEPFEVPFNTAAGEPGPASLSGGTVTIVSP